jgi:hypothetical protein
MTPLPELMALHTGIGTRFIANAVRLETFEIILKKLRLIYTVKILFEKYQTNFREKY